MSKIDNKVLTFIKNNDTNIITGIGIADGLLIGSYLWYKTGQKVNKRLTQKEIDIQRKLTFKEKVKETWKIFILPVCNTILSGGLLIYSARVGNKRLAALSAAYNLTEAALQQYMDKTKEVVGEKKAEAIAQEVAKDKFAEKPSNVIITGNGDVLFYESLSDRYFTSSWDKIQRAANELNAAAIGSFDNRITETEWFNKLGLKKTADSDEMGWSVQDDGRNGIIDISLDAILNEDNIPCGSIRYNTRPKSFRRD